MRFVIQRVSKASVKTENKIVGQIGRGMLILAGFAEDDQAPQVEKAAQKILKLRIFPDAPKAGRETKKDINTSIQDIGGEILVVSQFTLIADTSAGNRPSFIKAASPQKAEELYNLFIKELKKSGLKLATGRFGEYMEVELVNDGPVTIIYQI